MNPISALLYDAELACKVTLTGWVKLGFQIGLDKA